MLELSDDRFPDSTGREKIVFRLSELPFFGIDVYKRQMLANGLSIAGLSFFFISFEFYLNYFHDFSECRFYNVKLLSLIHIYARMIPAAMCR